MQLSCNLNKKKYFYKTKTTLNVIQIGYILINKSLNK